MAGIYLHVPFCKKACHYCDFHFSTSLGQRADMVSAIRKELVLRQDYLAGEQVETIYFGGGTPSLLATDDLQTILDTIYGLFTVSSTAEITLEANPDDLHVQKVKELSQSPINRLSIGVQSFFDVDLLWMNRSHTGAEADSCIKRSQDAGFENSNVDLIYGFPLLTDVKWQQNIEQIIGLDIPHLSSYSMTVEQGTALHHFIEKKKHSPLNEGQSAQQFLYLLQATEQAGLLQYEISNFAKAGKESIHNSNYWRGKKYMGVGPSAHSFNEHSRQWNVANNIKYLQSIAQNELPQSTEVLSLNNRFNEYLMTSLRTSWGTDFSKIKRSFGTDYLTHITSKLTEYEDKDWVIQNNNHLYLTKSGKLFADHIAADLFIIDDES
ncbi:MAG: radical SAM family heme chaperone HemW [Sphingobacteriaceae bacterium]